MKKIIGLFVAVLLSISMVVITVSADEKCTLAANGAEGECEIWWMFNAEGHWRACVEHRDASGNDTVVTEMESHEFVDGVCTVCEMKEIKGVGIYSYIFVFIVVVALGFLIPFKKNRSFKKNKFDEHPFGLDKFRKFP
ncbi:MAG: hypothetical protein IJZ53_12650 [Tyzzerella sp.]|nr:hypothetical protein [Tyzzerella sp.]